MGYYDFSIAVADESRDALMQMLSAFGCLGFVEQDDKIHAYFPEAAGARNIIAELSLFKTILGDAGLESSLSFDHVFIPEQDWNEAWKSEFKPIDVGDHFSILPPWEGPVRDRINLVIDPGMAFGTGHHETTRTCLELIEHYSRDCAKEGFLDVGTGTGILAIAASLLGFRRVVGVDTDPLAVDAAIRNAKLNNLSNITIHEGTAVPALGIFDFIAANLISEVLIGLAPDLSTCMGEKCIMLLSGMLAGQEDGVIIAMERQGLELLDKHADGRWVSLLMVRK